MVCISCAGADDATLIVELRTDFALGQELRGLELVTLDGPSAFSARVEPRDGAPLEGIRVLELEGVTPGRYHFAALGTLPRGGLLARTEVIADVAGTTVVRFWLTRDCAGLACPTDDPTRTACLGGVCEDPRCVAGDQDACATTVACEDDAACATETLACGIRRCVDGVCVADTSEVECGASLYCKPESGCVPPERPDGELSAAVEETCRDGVRADGETGIDCGGPCTECANDICPAQSDIPQAECLALVALYRSADGPAWDAQDGWMTASSPCTWAGVNCGDGHVTGLNLDSAGLRGPVAPELGNLTSLRTLDLGSNQLSGEIPPELSLLGALEDLELRENALTGRIPSELGALSHLARLDLDANALTGPIPASLGGLERLEVLRLHGNSLSGPIPPTLGQLRRLEELELHENLLTGGIPTTFGDLSALRELSLRDNLLTGPVPPEMGRLSNLEELQLALNGFSGSIPPELGQLASLTSMRLQSNALTGAIPPELGNLTALRVLRLDGNELTGPIPELDSLSDLTELRLTGSDLTGPIPAGLGSLTNLEDIDLTRNRLSGPIPPELGNLARLDSLHLSSNELTGTIPSELGALDSIRRLELEGNALEGEVPVTILALEDTLLELVLNRNACLESTDPELTAFLDRMDPEWMSSNRSCP